MKTFYSQFLSRFHLWADLIFLNLSYVLAGLIVLGDLNQLLTFDYVNLLLISNLIWIFCIYICGLYSFTGKTYDPFIHLCKLLITIAAHFIILEIALYLNGDMFNKREHFAFTAFEIFLAFELVANISLMIVSQYLQKSKFGRKRYAVMMNGTPANAFEDFHEDRRKKGFQLCGEFDLAEASTQYQHLYEFIRQEQPDYLYCWLRGMQPELVENIIAFSETQKTHVRLIPDHMNFSNQEFQVEYTERSPFMFINASPASDDNIPLIKRSFDLVFSLIVIIVGFPLFLLIAALVKIAFKGPVFSLEQRVGRWGQTFRIIKFRTAFGDAPETAFSSKSHQPFLGPVGYFLKRSRLDEMPQFINVLKGDMSIVGPRPLFKHDAEMLSKESHHDLHKILSLRPGITSIGQIQSESLVGSNENLDQLRHDMSYLDSFNLAKDLQLILLTIQLLLLGKGR